MRQTHIAGEKLFVGYAGQTMPIVDATTGEIRRAQIFVAVLGASNYTYACATATQTAADWVGSIIDALEFIGGVPRLIVPDQPWALIARPDRYDPPVGWSRSSHRTTAWRCFQLGQVARATSPRWKSACKSSNAGSLRGCATGACSAWPSSTRPSVSCWPT
jgi:hypothetical protein